ncbi:hypothetical protein O181_002370 [Austropuccinia psidii MF-1]|uniref:Uncharacterized protein n=1 Tax=Austropuccinia psidii MF-1 TaxID=1389203 RepID=A0A9Q3GCS2_9BASI|nr:hypothetical protein [Austropuccinia psidii MF-1]
MHCGPGGTWIENCQLNHTQTLFVYGGLMNDQNNPSSSQQPNFMLMSFKWYPNILFIIESLRKQDLKLKNPTEYDGNSNSQCQIFTPTSPTSSSTPPLYPAVLSLDQEIPKGPSANNLWGTLPPGSMVNSRHIITKKAVSSLQSLLANTPLGGILVYYMGLGKAIQDIALIGTYKEKLNTTPNLLNNQMEIRNIQECSGWSTESQILPWPHLSIIIQGQNPTV